MALRLRRGTDAERLTIIPQEGELIYTIDTKELYAGDGTTVGGNRISGSTDGSPAQLTQNLNLNSNNITGTGNININGFVTADFNGGLIGDVLGDIQGSVFANNSTLLVDALDGIIFAENVRGEFTGNVIGDIKGSVFADDSTRIINGLTGNIETSVIITEGTLEIDMVTSGANRLVVNSTDERSILKLTRSSNNDLTGDVVSQYGAILFERDDINGHLTTGIIWGREDSLYFGNDPAGDLSTNEKYFVWKQNKLGIRNSNPQEVLDVTGNVIASGFIQFGNFTTIERDALTITNGTVIYNTTADRFQGYQNSAWINLDDGTPA